MVQHARFLSNIASVFGETESTIQLVHRTLREAGMLHGQRGRHSPGRTPEDAAVFLCWLGVTDKPSLAPTAVEDFGNAPRHGRLDDSTREFLAGLGLPEDHTLLDMLAALISGTADGKSIAPYAIEFQPDELYVRMSGPFSGLGYTREHEDGAADVSKRHAKPYRVLRTLPKALIDDVATMFAEETAVDSAFSAKVAANG